MRTKYDLKTIFIFVLAGCLILSFLAGQKSTGSDYKDKIKDLELKAATLKSKNDSLSDINTKLDIAIVGFQKQINDNQVKLKQTQSQLDYLNKRRNETPIKVNRLSANGVASAFAEYLDKRTKSRNSN
jgi:cell division protein FtsB